MTTLVTFLFILGAIVGSFLNVLVLRYNTGRKLSGRSACPACKTPLSWRELIPVVSFFTLGGTCRHCGVKISPLYISVELTTAFLFAAVGASCASGACLPTISANTWFVEILVLSATAVLIAIAAYDIRHMIIPDGLVVLFIALAAVTFFYDFSAARFLAGLGAAAPFALLWLLSGGRWMGLGDAKLAVGIGWLLGPLPALTAIIVGFWAGALYGIGILMLRFLASQFLSSPRIHLFRALSRFTMKSEVPFAPFLIAGVFAVLIWRIDLFFAVYVF